MRSDGDGDGDGGRNRREQLSALMDGELDADAAAGCCELWREQSEARANWHLYHLIGDVLRADSRHVTCCDGERSARLLKAVRGRLAAEPPLRRAAMAMLRRRPPEGVEGGRRRPAALAAAPRWRVGWLAGAAAAAFAAVAGVIVVIDGVPAPAGSGAGATLAGATPPATPVAAALQQPPAPVQGAQLAAAPPPTEAADMQLLRDARLDQYLAAHTQFGGSSALGVPSGFLRSSTLQVPGR